MHNPKDYIQRHARHIALPQFGQRGLQLTAAAKVLIVGCGGLGAPVIQYLAAAGIGQLTLCDSDIVELSNLNRQTLFHTEQIGHPKAKAAAQYVRLLNPDVQVNYITERVGLHNVQRLIQEHDLLIDCTDGLPNKLLLNDAAVLFKRPLIHGAATGLEGRLLIYLPQHACLRCLFPQQLHANSIGSCLESGILGPICGVVGSLMAVEAIKLIINQYSSKNVSKYFIIKCQEQISINTININISSDCPLCGNNPTIANIYAENYNLDACEII